jgi:hypothetical protein
LETVDVSPREFSAKVRVNIDNPSFDAIADIGSDHSALDKLTVDRLRKEGVFIATKALSQPMTLPLAIEVDGAGEIQKRQAFVANEVASVTLVLELAVGPLAKRNLQMVVVEAPVPNLLPGEPGFFRTGFNAKQHLGSVRE